MQQLKAFDLVALLDGEETIKEYLLQVDNEGCPQEKARALNYIAHARTLP
ncbi:MULTISPECIES: hypothetical protein [Pseudomonas]|uniref:Uncharacterized protein n=1 Tax=Pseudomonas fluorescens TaxID=294 RepID=A0A5E6S099_PSEFL|nr:MULTISPECIES: hypothetical protein [Pseudomonas]VVM69778.1 hypothetical protein PS652_01716 [Pseudomonas fluorescens]